MEQSATPWRAFDAPSSSTGEGSGEPAPPPPGGPAAKVAGPQTTKLAIAGVAGAVVIGIVAVVVALSGSGGQIVDAPDKAIAGSNDTPVLMAGGEVVVDVTGAVAKPGVYRLPAGSRVGDAIDAAGGFSPRIDADKVTAALNLAATLTDGSQVHVPSRDDPAATAPGGGGSGAAGGAAAGGGGKTNLNTASQSELEALPGIGPVTAAKIIESRTATPFTSIEQLRERKLVGEKAFDQLKSLVAVG